MLGLNSPISSISWLSSLLSRCHILFSRGQAQPLFVFFTANSLAEPVSEAAVNGQSFLVIDGYLLNPKKSKNDLTVNSRFRHRLSQAVSRKEYK